MSGGSRGIIGRIWELVTGLFSNSTDIKSKTDQLTFDGGNLKVTSTGGGGDLTPVVDELIELNAKVATEATLDLVNDGIDVIELNTIALEERFKLFGRALQVDEVGTTTYVGYAVPGTATASGTWAIQKIVETGGSTVITWADGNNNFDNIWDNRLALIYS